MSIGLIGSPIHPDPKSVLVVGHGAGGTAYAAGLNPTIEHVRVVEINSSIYQSMSSFVALGGKMESIDLSVIPATSSALATLAISCSRHTSTST